MSEQAKVTMMVSQGLEPAELEKVERLDGPISERFIRAGLVARLCRGGGTGAARVLDFCGPSGVVGTISAVDFLVARDEDVVARIELLGT